MATTREQLIADWRERLAAAEEPQPADSQRAAWLARLRARLYRFLLSLYGDGHWNAAPPSDAESPHAPADSVVFDAPEVLPLAGKPAKDESSIRAVLESVASARQHAPEVGPLAAGIDRDVWAIVASASQSLDPQLCADALKEAGISSRLVGRYADVTVEVRRQHQWAAANWIASRPSSLRLSRHPTEHTRPQSPELQAEAAKSRRDLLSLLNTSLTVFAAFLIAFFLAWLLVAFDSIPQFASEPSVRIFDFLSSEEFIGVSACSLLLCLEIIFFHLLRRRRTKSSQ